MHAIAFFFFFFFLLLYPVEFPELTSQHIDKSFRGTGANYAQIEHLGMLLHLPKDKIVSIKTANNHSYNGPSMFAVDIIEAWLKDDPQRIGPNIQAQYVELEEKLREAHLNCVAGRIRKKNPEGMIRNITSSSHD